MAEYLIQDTTLTSIADEVRTLSGTEETLSPEAMKEKVAEGNENIVAEADLIMQIQAALEGKSSESGENTSLQTSTLVIEVDNHLSSIIISYIDNKLQIRTVELNDINSGETNGIQNILTGSLFWLQGTCAEIVEQTNITLIHSLNYTSTADWDYSYFTFQIHDDAFLCLRNPEDIEEDMEGDI